MKIGQRIREARKAAGMTQDQLAAKVGMRQNSISELEKGDSAGTTNVAKFAQALRVNALWLETGMGERSSIGTQEPALSPETAPERMDAIAEKLDAMVRLDLITALEAAILKRYRMASTDGKSKIQTMADLAERDQLFVVHHQANS